MLNEDILQKLRIISNKNISGYNEENIKIHIVVKLLEILGYHDDLDLEHNYGTDRPDIIIKRFEHPIIVEIKGSNENLLSYIEQIKRYSYNMDSFLTILTNGLKFYFFNPFWRRTSFEDRLILSLNLQDLAKEDIVEKVMSILYKDIGYDNIIKNIEKIQKEIVDKEENIKNQQDKIYDLENKIKLSREKYLNVDKLKEHIEYLEPGIKLDIEGYLNIEKEIDNIKKEINLLKEQIPKIEGSIEKITRSINKRHTNSSLSQHEDFEMGISDEVINIRALEQGKQIVICRSQKKSNNHIFLIPKVSFDSGFVPSENGRKLMYNPIEKDTTQYIAEIIEYLPVPGTNRKFWEDLYNEKEFNLWEIDNGPLKFFKESSRNQMFLWIFRVYEMSFKISVDKDFERSTMNNARICNLDTIKKIQSGFLNKEFKPILTDEEFESRKKKILELTKKY